MSLKDEIKNQKNQKNGVIIHQTFVSDLGADSYNYMSNRIDQNEVSGYFTSSSARDKYKGSKPVYTGDKDPNRTAGSGQKLGNGLANALSVKDEIKNQLETSEANFISSISAFGGGSSAPYILVRAKLWDDLCDEAGRNENTELSFDSFDLDNIHDTEIKSVKQVGFIDTILVPSKSNSSTYANYEASMSKLLNSAKDGGAITSYQLVKADDVQRRSNGVNSEQENMIAVSQQHQKLHKIIDIMVSMKATEGTDIDLSEVYKLINSKGEIVANIGEGYDMKEALTEFKKNMEYNNSEASLLGATDVLVKFIYNKREYTDKDTRFEAQIVEELDQLATVNGMQATLKKSVITGCKEVNQPTIVILAGGIMDEDTRGKQSKAEANMASQRTESFIFGINGAADDSSSMIKQAFDDAGVTMTKNGRAYSAYLSKSVDAIENSNKLTDAEKSVLVSLKSV